MPNAKWEIGNNPRTSYGTLQTRTQIKIFFLGGGWGGGAILSKIVNRSIQKFKFRGSK